MATVKKTILNTKNAGCKCAKEQVLLEINKPFDKAHLQFFIGTGFSENKTYGNLGLLYIETINLVAIGPFGSNRLNIKCKTANCQNDIIKLEDILRIL